MGSRTNLTCNVGIQDWDPTAINERHSGNHLRVTTAFCTCVAPYCEDFRENYAIAVHGEKLQL